MQRRRMQRRRMQRQFVLHRREAAEMLPVRVFEPACDDRLVRFVEGVFQVVQANHQSQGLAWRAIVGAITFGEHAVKPLPIDLVGENHQRMIGIENLIEVSLKQFQLAHAGSRAGLHGSPKLQGFEGDNDIRLQILLPTLPKRHPSIAAPAAFFRGRLTIRVLQTGGLQRVSQEHRDGERPDTAGNRCDVPGDLTSWLEIDIAHQPIIGPIDPHVDHRRARLNHLGSDKSWTANRSDENIGLSRD